MRVTCVSDLHLEFGALDKPLPEGDVLLLAGDSTVVRYLDPRRTDPNSRSVQRATKRLNDEIARKFQRAYAVVGNHEPYGSYYHEASGALARALPAVRIMHCDHVKLSDGVLLFGAPLWTDMDRENPLSMLAIRDNMNDFIAIRGRDGHPFLPQEAVQEFHKAIKYLGTLAETNRDKTIVVMTHHSPSRLGSPPGIPHNVLDGAYYSNLEEFILDHPNIRFWTHGHTHFRSIYQIGQCQVITNARGYYQHDHMWKTFDPTVGFDVEEKFPLDTAATSRHR